MKPVLFALALTLGMNVCLAAKAEATTSKQQVQRLLKTNPVVIAAVQQAKAFAGSSKCRTTIKLDPEGFNKYSAVIYCQGEGHGEGSGSGIVEIKGQLWEGSLQELDLSIRFAG